MQQPPHRAALAAALMTCLASAGSAQDLIGIASDGVYTIDPVTGAIGSVGHYLLIAAHKLAPPALITPFMYTQLVWGIALGYLVFSQLPNVWTLAGATIVIASGLYIFNRERKHGAGAVRAAGSPEPH